MKMNFVKITLNKYNVFRVNNSSNINMRIIGKFLTDDVLFINYWLEWLKSNNLTGMCGNATYQDKTENGYIVIGDIIIDDGITLKIKSSELVKLLKKWDQLRIKKVDEIIVTEENGAFEIFEVQ